MTQRFQTLTLTTCTSEKAAAPASVTMIDNVISLLLDQQTRARAAPTPHADNRHAWRMAVLDVQLPALTRRPFVANVKVGMNAVHGHALVRISADERTTSRQLWAKSEPKAAEIAFNLHIRRSTQARDHLRLHIWTEATAHAESGQAEAVVDAVDVQAR